MSKYKLIKEYPDSPELGSITDETMYFPASYPEFWEKIVEKEQFEVLRTTGIIVAAKVPYEFRLETKYVHQITSIKRLTDNTTLSIGDKIKCENSHVDKPEVITKIELNKEGTPCLFTKSFHNNGVNIFKAVKYEKLLTSEDGVDMYQNDVFWHVDTYFGIGKGYLKENQFNPLIGYKHFSTEKAAKEYVNLNKPMYSKKDLLDASINMQYGKWFIEGLIKRLSK